jgi:UDPglucose--hexose-1-phosphate uridylyltransferase
VSQPAPAGAKDPRPELRIDPLTGLRTILAAGAEVLAAEAGGSPEGRPPAVSPPPRPGANPSRDLFWCAPAVGHHEHLRIAGDATLAELDGEQLAMAAERWRERMRAHAEAACLHLSVSSEPGAPVRTDLFALPFVPAAIARERERFAAYATRTMGANALADLVQEEVRRGERIVAIDEEAVCMAPYASRVPYQLMIAPRRARPRFEDDGPTGARLLHEAIGRLSRCLGTLPALTLWVRTAPRGAEHFCWRIDVLPHPPAPGQLELGAGLAVNGLAPERAAARLRGS